MSRGVELVTALAGSLTMVRKVSHVLHYIKFVSKNKSFLSKITILSASNNQQVVNFKVMLSSDKEIYKEF